MDAQWAEEKLVTYLSLCESVRRAVPPGSYWNDQAQAFNQEAELMLHTVESIMRCLDPTDTVPLRPPAYSGENSEERVRKALGALRDREDIAAHLAPESPEMLADQLHPTVWRAAAVTWDSGQYRVAVGQAALGLATNIKARAESRLTDRKLMQDVFSPDTPRAGSTRLHFPGDRDDDNWKSRQQGLHLLAQGVYAGIRNIAAHLDEDWPEQEALEYLAALSVVARWSDATELVRG